MPDIEEKASRPPNAPSSGDNDSKDDSGPDLGNNMDINVKQRENETLDDTRERILREAEEQLAARRAELKEQDNPILPFANFFGQRRKGFDMTAIATQPSIYDNEAAAPFFQPHDRYENKHRFDPKARWSWAEELPLVDKMDFRITLWACIAFFGLDLGRGNLSQANTDNFLEDMGMTTNDYNLGNTVYQIAFLCAELPSQMVSKKLGPDRWLPFLMVAWSITSGAQFWLDGRPSFLGTRAILGLLHGGFIPDIVLYLTYFFKSNELPMRLAAFWCVRRVTDIIAPIIAFGVLRMRGVLGYEGWRWLFLIEGIIMFTIAIWSIFMMNPSPTQTKRPWRPNGWFSEREETILVNRILRDDPSKCGMHNRQGITLKMLWKSLSDYELWPIYIFGLLWEMPVGPPDLYLTLTLRNLGFGTFDANLLSIPCQFLGAVNMCITVYFSTIWNERAAFGIWTQFWYLPNLIAMAVLPTGTSAWAQYAVVTVLLSYPSPHPMHVSWASRNSNSVRTRAVSAALYNMMVQLARVIFANIYREDDAPEYRRGNRVLIAIACMNICVYGICKGFYIYKNKTRDRVWNAMTEEERIRYLETTNDKGSAKKDFRFVH